MAHNFDHYAFMQGDLQRILENIYFTLMNFRLLVDIITGSRYNTETYPIVETTTVRESYIQRMVPNIDSIDRSYIIANASTNIIYPPMLEAVMKTGYVNYPINEYVLNLYLNLRDPEIFQIPEPKKIGKFTLTDCTAVSYELSSVTLLQKYYAKQFSWKWL